MEDTQPSPGETTKATTVVVGSEAGRTRFVRQQSVCRHHIDLVFRNRISYRTLEFVWFRKLHAPFRSQASSFKDRRSVLHPYSTSSNIFVLFFCFAVLTFYAMQAFYICFCSLWPRPLYQLIGWVTHLLTGCAECHRTEITVS